MPYLLTLIHCVTLVATLGVCIYLFITVKHEVHVLEARYLRRGENLRAQLNEVAQELDAVRQELEVMEQRSDPSAAVGRTLGSGVRIQALRMIRHGESPEQIAAELGLPRNEVELLIKVQRLIADRAEQLTS